MGERFQSLRANENGVVVDREENIFIERGENNFVKRRKTITRKRFSNAQSSNSLKKQSENSKLNDKSASPVKIGTIKSPIDLTFLNKPLSASEVSSLRNDIDAEIAKLRRRRQRLLNARDKGANEHDKMGEKRRSTVRNDRTWDQNLKSNKVNKENGECKVKEIKNKHRSQAPKVCKSCQTTCRPRMRTIGLQKNDTVKRCCGGGIEKYLKDNFNISDIKLKYNPASEVIPTAYGCFEYEPNCALTEYCNGCCYNNAAAGSYNGLLCSQNTYCGSGRTPCSEYNYCQDTYYYNCAPPCTTFTAYQPCAPYQSCTPGQSCTPCRPSKCYCRKDYCQCNRKNHRRKKTDLNTEEIVAQRNEAKKLLETITLKQAQLEREEARARARKEARKKLRSSSKAKEVDPKKQEESAARIAAQLIGSDKHAGANKTSGKQASSKHRNDSSDGSVDSGSTRQVKIKREKLKVINKRSCTARNNTYGYDYDDCCCCPPCCEPAECDVETERTLEKMCITTYKPSRKRRDKALQNEGDNSDAQQVTDDKKEKRYEEYIKKYKQKPSTESGRKDEKTVRKAAIGKEAEFKKDSEFKKDTKIREKAEIKKLDQQDKTDHKTPLPRRPATVPDSSGTQLDKGMHDGRDEMNRVPLQNRLLIRKEFLLRSQQCADWSPSTIETKQESVTCCDEFVQEINVVDTTREDLSPCACADVAIQQPIAQERIVRQQEQKEFCRSLENNIQRIRSAADAHTSCDPMVNISGEELLRHIKDRQTDNQHTQAANAYQRPISTSRSVSAPRTPRLERDQADRNYYSNVTSRSLPPQSSPPSVARHQINHDDLDCVADMPPCEWVEPDDSCPCDRFCDPTVAKPQSSESDYLSMSPRQQYQQQPQQYLPRYIPCSRDSFRREVDQEEILRRRNLEARLRFCEEICQQTEFYKDKNNVVKCASVERTTNRQYSDEDCTFTRDTQEQFLLKEPMRMAKEDYLEDTQLSSRTLGSHYGTASSRSFGTTSYGTNEDCGQRYVPLRRSRARQIREMPEFTGCPCMMNTYLEIISSINNTASSGGICGSTGSMSRSKNFSERRITFR